MQEIPCVLSAATRLAYLDISENDFIIPAKELHWLSVILQRNSHLQPNGLKVRCRLVQHVRRHCSIHIVHISPRARQSPVCTVSQPSWSPAVTSHTNVACMQFGDAFEVEDCMGCRPELRDGNYLPHAGELL